MPLVTTSVKPGDKILSEIGLAQKDEPSRFRSREALKIVILRIRAWNGGWGVGGVGCGRSELGEREIGRCPTATEFRSCR